MQCVPTLLAPIRTQVSRLACQIAKGEMAKQDRTVNTSPHHCWQLLSPSTVSCTAPLVIVQQPPSPSSFCFYHHVLPRAHPLPAPQDIHMTSTSPSISSGSDQATVKGGLNLNSPLLRMPNFWSLTFSTSSVVAGSSQGPASWPTPSQPKRMRTETFLGWSSLPHITHTWSSVLSCWHLTLFSR